MNIVENKISLRAENSNPVTTLNRTSNQTSYPLTRKQSLDSLGTTNFKMAKQSHNFAKTDGDEQGIFSKLEHMRITYA